MKNGLSVLGIFLVPFLLLAACSPAPTASSTGGQPPLATKPTITFEGGICSYSGMKPLPANSEVAANWVVKDTGAATYMLQAFTVADGKTLDDAKSGFLSGAAGAWVSAGAAEALGGSSKDFSIRTGSGPLYFACGPNPANTVFLGPIDVQ